jgi:redox-sensing transcriptional repressor
MSNKQIPVPTLRRLPNYYNIICEALNDGQKFISSAKIANALAIDDTQVRKDIATTGYVGKPKIGFDVKDFKEHLENFLGFKTFKPAFLIGAGNLGIALAKYDGFKKYGLEIVGIFDTDPQKISLKISNKEVYPIAMLPELIKKQNVRMAILCIPQEYAQSTTDFIVEAGIKAIWNFAPATLKVPEGIHICNQDLAASFIALSLMLEEENLYNLAHTKNS